MEWNDSYIINSYGPILWQFSQTKRFDAYDFAAFLALLLAR
jgi:hypothetical protein